MKRQYYLFFITSFFLINSCDENIKKKIQKQKQEEELIERALKIHKKVLTLDTHADTPLRMIEPGFDLSERHDPNETGSKVTTHE